MVTLTTSKSKSNNDFYFAAAFFTIIIIKDGLEAANIHDSTIELHYAIFGITSIIW